MTDETLSASRLGYAKGLTWLKKLISPFEFDSCIVESGGSYSIYKWDDYSTEDDDGFRIIESTKKSDGRWILKQQGGSNTISGQIDYPLDGEYVLDLNTYKPGIIDKLFIQSDAGTCTADLKIDETSVTGISAVSVSSAKSTATATAEEQFTAGQKISLNLTSVSGVSKLYFTLAML